VILKIILFGGDPVRGETDVPIGRWTLMLLAYSRSNAARTLAAMPAMKTVSG
jgi:hypothetical protein